MYDTHSHPPIILASGSRYRAELLERLDLPFEADPADIDETPGNGESGEVLAVRLARAKAEAVAVRRPDALIIGSDQVAECDGRLMGKPGTPEAAVEQLLFCSGRDVLFHTAVAMVFDGRMESAMAPTRVSMRRLDRSRLERYVAAEQPLDCAGAMKSEALGISLCERIANDDPTALIGLPLTRVVALLDRFGIRRP
jgi:septum formation protein